MSFISEVKSTLDFHLGNYAKAIGKPYFDIDQSEWMTQAIEDTVEGVFFSLASMQQDPSDPLWSALYSVGIRLHGDLAQYETLKLSDIPAFRLQEAVPVFDYSGATAPNPAADKPTGFLLLVESRLEPVSFDRINGIRPTQYHAKAWRLVA